MQKVNLALNQWHNELPMTTLKRVLALMPGSARSKIFVLAALQTLSTILDAIALIVFAIVSKAGIDYLQGNQVQFSEPLIRLLNVDEKAFSYQISLLMAFVCFLLLFRTTFSFVLSKLTLQFLGREAAGVADRLLSSLMKCRPSFVTNLNRQELVYVFTVGLDNLLVVFLGACITLITEALFIAGIFGTLLYLQPLTGLSTILFFGFTFLATYRFSGKQSQKIGDELSQATVSYGSKLEESLRMFNDYRLRGQSKEISDFLEPIRSSAFRKRTKLLSIPNFTKYIIEIALLVGGLLTALISYMISGTGGALAAIILFFLSGTRFLPALMRAQGALLTMKQSEGVASSTIEQILNLERELQEFRLSETLQEFERQEIERKSIFFGEVEMKNISFAFPGKVEPFIANVSLQVKPGEFVAIVGSSGSGKSTLVELMLGIKQPSKGQVLISGFEPEVAIKKWPGKISYVPQQVQILNDSIFSNVALSRNISSADRENVIENLEKTFLIGEIEIDEITAPSIMQETKRSWSGGQRQRIGIARALYSQPKLLFLDEATSALDYHTEERLLRNLYLNRGTTTLVVIAHRLTTVLNADRILVLKDGQIESEGTFESLVESSVEFAHQVSIMEKTSRNKGNIQPAEVKEDDGNDNR